MTVRMRVKMMNIVTNRATESGDDQRAVCLESGWKWNFGERESGKMSCGENWKESGFWLKGNLTIFMT